ncbi:MAG: hydrogenase maturation protease [Bacteroidia bacterium]|nr:hydrogenase maturation protease [Bacteroidia bacterium]
MKKHLLVAIGNSGRQDDGLGWAFADEVSRQRLFDGELHYRYQLQVEDAEMLSCADKVIFVDAFKGELAEGYCWTKIKPAAVFEFSTHALSPESVLYLSRDLYDSEPEAWVLLIEGKQWELAQELSERAAGNLKEALNYFQTILKNL